MKIANIANRAALVLGDQIADIATGKKKVMVMLIWNRLLHSPATFMFTNWPTVWV